MIWKSDCQLHKYISERYPDNYIEVVKGRIAQALASDIAKNITITQHDPNPTLSTEEYNKKYPHDRDPEITYRADIVLLPIEQWEHIKGMLRIIRKSANADIIHQIIDEVENK